MALEVGAAGPRAFMDYTRLTQNGGYEGWIEVDGQRGYRDQRRGYRGYNNRRGYNNGTDRGSFKCEIRRGRVVDIDYNGIRGLNRL